MAESRKARAAAGVPTASFLSPKTLLEEYHGVCGGGGSEPVVTSRRYEVIVVGGGPAGSAAALALARRDRALAERCLLIDAAVFPRDKLCGGGLVTQADRLLAHLGVASEVPSVAINEMRVEYDGGCSVLRRPGLFRVVRRLELDRSLLRAVAERGVAVLQGEPVLHVKRADGALRVITTRGEYRAEIVIGADGACSRVRRALVGPTLGDRFVALEIMTPGHEPEASRAAVFDFSPVVDGLRGYAWHFPLQSNGTPITARGIGGTSWPVGASLSKLFARRLEKRGLSLDDHELRGWSLPLYHPQSRQGAERVLLAGDAVGVDPWLGEGISVALGTGILAAHAAADGLDEGRLDFSDHAERVRDSAVGWLLERQRKIAAPFYEAAARPQALSAFLGRWGAS